MTLTVDDFDYNLPHELIAQTPIKERDESRLLVLDHKTGILEDKHLRVSTSEVTNPDVPAGQVISQTPGA